jgi:hypothetical protein
VVRGLNSLTEGPLSQVQDAALRRAAERGFGGS